MKGKRRKAVTATGEWIESHLRRLCGRITPSKRVTVILIVFFLFAFGSLYFTISSIYHFGKDKGKHIQIEQIKRLEVQPQQKEYKTDSLEQLIIKTLKNEKR